MKKTLLTLLTVFIALTTTAQQQGINYKALIKDASGNVLASTFMNVQFTICATSATGTIVYQENHVAYTTTVNGMIVLNIGTGTPAVGTFNTIDWAADTHYLNTTISYSGGSNVDLGTTQFMAVPYAKQAETATHAITSDDTKWAVGTTANDITNNNTGTVEIAGTLQIQGTANIDAFSIDGTFANNSDTAIPTEKAIKTYVDSNLATGLETLDEGNGIGWRLKGRDPNNYGNIGFNAIDLSYTDFASTTKGATGNYSTAMGYATTASGDYSTAMGSHTTAFGVYSTAMGINTTASGDYSTAMGSNTTASGISSTAMGSNTIAEAHSSTAIGSYNVGGGNPITGVGTDPLFEIGNGTFSTRSNALTVYKNGSFATNNNVASGNRSTAMGSSSTASGVSSTAMGFSTTATGSASTAMGDATTALGYASIAMGRFTTASAFNSTAMGFSTTASGISSTAMGSYTQAKGDHTTAMGLYNYDLAGQDRLLIVGNGTSSNRGNAFTVYRGTDANLTTFNSGYVMIGNNSGANLLFDTNEIMARNNGAASPLYLQNDGGSVYVGGSIVHSSDRRLKKDIETLSYGLKEVLQLQPKAYNWKNRTQEYKSLGLIAQEVQPIIKEVVTTKDNEQKTLGISYTELIPVLINAIKEQDKIITNSKLRIANYESEVSDLKSAVNSQKEDFTALLARIEQLEQKNTKIAKRKL